MKRTAGLRGGRRRARLSTIVFPVSCALLSGLSPAASGRADPVLLLGPEARLAAHHALEELRGTHRVIPADVMLVAGGAVRQPAESLERDRLERRIQDLLAKSRALAARWGRPVSRDDLQAELERMAARTRQPARLRAMFAALGDDPLLVAECLARPVLVERRIRELYAFDPELHDQQRQRLEAILHVGPSLDELRRSGASIVEQEWRVQPQAHAPEWLAQEAPPPDAERGAGIEIFTPEQWQERPAALRLPPSAGGIPPGHYTTLEETATAFRTHLVLERSRGRVKMRTVVWEKMPFDSWWREARHAYLEPLQDAWSPGPPVASAPYVLPEISGSTCTDDTWTPTPADASSPSPRRDHTAVWTGNEMIIWGGRDAGPLASGGLYEPATDSWTATRLDATTPAARFDHTAVWTGSEMIVWGGFGGVLLADGARYDPASNSWAAISAPPAGITPRFRHTAVWTGTEMIVWGGYDGAYLDTGARYAPSTDAWAVLGIGGEPPVARAYHSAVWTGSEMIVWGGYDGLELQTGGRYNLAGDQWTGTSTGTSVPVERRDHTAVWAGTEMIVWGGVGLRVEISGGRYDPVGDAWQPTPLTGDVPSLRHWHTAVWTDREMIIWGGVGGGSTGSRYSGYTNAWLAMSPEAGPGQRSHHSAVWTEDGLMIVWGGYDAVPLGTGGVYCAQCSTLDWHADADNDLFGAIPVAQTACDPPPGHVLDGTDCDDADSAVYPGAPGICDGVNNDCLDPVWPSLAGTEEADDDGDGLSECAGDCNDTAAAVWAIPGEVRDLSFGSTTETISWQPPLAPGGTAVGYDTLRTSSAVTFDSITACACVEWGDASDMLSTDMEVPDPGLVFFYLVRGGNLCGAGTIGFTSAGVERAGRPCP